MRDKLLFVRVGVFLMCLTLPTWAHAQEAFAIPRSDRFISGSLTLPGNKTARFIVQDGTWVTVERKGEGAYFFAFTGRINDQTGDPNFIPFRLNRGKTDSEKVDVIELDQDPRRSPDFPDPARDIPIGESRVFRTARNIELEVIGTGVAKFSAPYISDASTYDPEDLEKRFGYSNAAVCCVTCQGVTVCGSSVDTSCGGCSSGGGPRIM